jgi:hypothetical protein
METRMTYQIWELNSHDNPRDSLGSRIEKFFPMTEVAMYRTQPIMTGGCQCGAVRYALFEAPVASVCHCRMCQKAVGGPFAALSKLRTEHFAWTKGEPASFQSSSAAERHFCAACGTPLTFHFLDGEEIEVTTGSLDAPATLPPTKNFGVESRLPWLDLLVPGRLPEVTTEANAKRDVVSRQHPDHDRPAV